MQSQHEHSPTTSSAESKPRRRISGLTWILIAIAALFILGGLITALKTQHPPDQRRPTRVSNRPSVGVNEFNDTDNGVSVNAVDPPGGPADKAGLIGGDIVTSFDGHAVQKKEEILRVLEQTPADKTVEIIYLRDGTIRKTQLTTISAEQRDDLAETFNDRAAGQGQLGFNEDHARRVPIAGTSIFGVQIKDLNLSGPGALAGIQAGDIIIEFDGIPIRTVLELVLRVRRAVPYSTVKVVVVRGDERITIPVKVGKRG
jgi:S1-C subfamily serine protease